MTFNVNYKNGDVYNDKVVTGISVTRRMKPKREDRFGHYVYWKNYKKCTEGKCNFSSFGLNNSAYRKVKQGINDIATVAPWMVSWFKDSAVPYTHAVTSKHKVDWICPYCGAEIKNRPIVNFYYYKKVICPNCSDGMSYPERFLSNLFTSCNIDFQFHKHFSWSNGREYDFYIEPLNMIIETHGKQHYTNTWSVWVDQKQSMSIKDIDELKEMLAKNNNIQHYVVLNCSESNHEYISQSILSSILVNFYDFSNVDWRDIGIKSLKSIFMNIVDSYNAGHSQEETLKMFKVSSYTYYRYIKKAKALDLLDKNITPPKIKANKRTYKNTIKSGERTISTECMGLTKREIEVCALAVREKEFKEIGQIIGVAYTTVVEHKKNAYKKLSVHTKRELIDLYQSDANLRNILDNTNVCHDSQRR